MSQQDKYLALEKTAHENVSMLPSVRKKAAKIAKEVFGTSNNKFSTVITYLINKEYKELFNK